MISNMVGNSPRRKKFYKKKSFFLEKFDTLLNLNLKHDLKQIPLKVNVKLLKHKGFLYSFLLESITVKISLA